MGALYMVKDGNRDLVLAAEREGKLYVFVPNFEAFVYNKPMSVDFAIDRNLTYQPLSTEAAADIVEAGSVGMIDEQANQFLLDNLKSEPSRMTLDEALAANRPLDPPAL